MGFFIMVRNWLLRVVGSLALLAALPHDVSAKGIEKAGPPLPPLPYSVLKRLHDDPAAWTKFRAEHAVAPPAIKPATTLESGGLETWAPLTWLTVGAWDLQLSNPILLTDGSVIAHISCTGSWYRLKPDDDMSYASAKWEKIASLPAGYTPRFFASAVLPDGRVIIEGGEYDGPACTQIESNRGAIYDPVKDTWTEVPPPHGWPEIGDSQAIVLPDGRFVMTAIGTAKMAILDPATLTWHVSDPPKPDEVNDEENWTLLPDGNLLSVLGYVRTPCSNEAMVYKPSAAAWFAAGNTINRLSGCSAVKNGEAPTQALMPAVAPAVPKVAAFGATASLPSQNRPVYTALYDTNAKRWSVGPNMPRVGGIYYTAADAPASVVRDGRVLLAASPGTWADASTNGYPPPTHFFLFNGRGFTKVGDVPDSPQMNAYQMQFLALPNGDILGLETDYANNSMFKAATLPKEPSWRPVITNLAVTTLTQGKSYKLTGSQLSGLTQGAVYGDDGQMDTNFPLVLIVNKKTGHKAFARTRNFSRSVKPGFVSSTSFTMPDDIETGASQLRVVANGNWSAPIDVTVLAPALAGR
jgi:hypothetical protein